MKGLSIAWMLVAVSASPALADSGWTTSTRRVVPTAQLADPFAFTIAQDGAKVAPDSAILE